jgi:hypothetical protein
MKTFDRIMLAALVVIALGILFKLGIVDRQSDTASVDGITVGTQALYGTNYAWIDSLALTTTGLDSHFTNKFYQVSFWSPDADIDFRIGSPDTSDWDNRKWGTAIQGQVINVGSATKAVRMEWRTQSGTGTLIMVGYKTTAQY